jgi:hypothetical protein
MTLEDLWMQRICQGQVVNVLNLYTPNAVLVATFAPAPLTTRTQLKNYFVEFIGGKPGLCGKILSKESRQISKNSYVSSGLYEFYWNDNGKTATQKARYTYVWVVDQYDNWKILTHHSSVVP